ncbi:MAG TPA: acyl-CoA dehydrogenase family protein [Spirochaetota bacterium]|nr:acyl-CoA dehydrogenase family protein [Spirochaetota bacterium]
MSNILLPQDLNQSLHECIQLLDSQSSVINNLSTTERVLAYYSIYCKNKLHVLLLPEEYGGLSGSFSHAGIIVETLAYNYYNTLPTLLTTIHCYELIKSFADNNKKKWLLNAVNNTPKPLAFCLTEEHAGSDITSIQTTAIKNDNKIIINGKKVIVINSGIASFYLVIAQSSKKGRAGLTAFLIPETADNISFEKLEVSSFLHSVIGTVTFNNVIIDTQYQIGDEGSGFFLLTEMLDKGRPLVAACCVGAAQHALDIIIDHTKTRKQFSRYLYDFQGISFPIAEFETRLHAARLLYNDACEKIDNNEPFTKEASMAKYYASRLFLDITNFGMDTLGYRSIIDASEMKLLNDFAKTMIFIDGTENVQKMIIASLL